MSPSFSFTAIHRSANQRDDPEYVEIISYMRDQAVLQPQHEQEGQTDALPNGLDRPSHLLLGYNDVRV